MPTIRVNIHNANLLGAALLCRVSSLTSDGGFTAPALRVARYSASQQHEDGSWAYGEAETQQWIDNFHTGFNLGALRDLGRYLETTEFDLHLRNGVEFYRTHFVREDGAARYFHDKTYPIDIHCVAQSIITLVAFRHLHPDNLRLAYDVFRWAQRHMWDERGFFYYRVVRGRTIRTSYMRWSQAWMLLASAVLVNKYDGVTDDEASFNPRQQETVDLSQPASVQSTLGDAPLASVAYVLVTPARNEAAFIELTLRSMVAQTHLPLKWVVVSDGSTDGTDEVVSKYAAEHGWIELARMPERRERHFAGKVHAFNAGYERVKGLGYQAIRQHGRRHLVRSRLLLPS